MPPSVEVWVAREVPVQGIFNTLMQPMFTDHLLLAPVMRTVHTKRSKMHKKASLCGGYRYGEGAEDGGKDRKITKEIKRIFPVMIKVLWEKKKKKNQTQQGDSLGDFLFCSSTRKKGKCNVSITEEKWKTMVEFYTASNVPQAVEVSREAHHCWISLPIPIP